MSGAVCTSVCLSCIDRAIYKHKGPHFSVYGDLLDVRTRAELICKPFFTDVDSLFPNLLGQVSAVQLEPLLLSLFSVQDSHAVACVVQCHAPSFSMVLVQYSILIL